MFDLTGKTALVTGASGGIGAAIARALHAQGASDRDPLELPAGEFVRVAIEEFLRWMERDPTQGREGEPFDLGLVGAMEKQRAFQVAPHEVHGVHRGERILQDQLHLLGVVQGSFCMQINRSAVQLEFARGRNDDPREHPREHRLARAALTDHCGDSPGHQVKTGVVDGVHDALSPQSRPGNSGAEVSGQVPGAQLDVEFDGIAHGCSDRGWSASAVASSPTRRDSSTGTATPAASVWSQHATERSPSLIVTSAGTSIEQRGKA